MIRSVNVENKMYKSLKMIENNYHRYIILKSEFNRYINFLRKTIHMQLYVDENKIIRDEHFFPDQIIQPGA